MNAKKPPVLLTNDDALGADGLLALRQALDSDWTVYTVAPSEPMSQCSHRVTTHEPLIVEEHDARTFAVHGTPADCVRLALSVLLPERPRWVFSGINHGGNLGADIYVSGTIAAVREGVFLGVPGMAFSHYLRRGVAIDWEWAGRMAGKVVNTLASRPLAAGRYWNVNLPHLDAAERETAGEPVHCAPCTEALPVAYDLQTEDNRRVYQYVGNYSERRRLPESDVAHCFGGKVTISELRLHSGYSIMA